MTEKEFLKNRYKPFMIIDHQKIDGEVSECVLVAIDFDIKQFQLAPLEDGIYLHEEFWASYKNCQISRPKLKKA